MERAGAAWLRVWNSVFWVSRLTTDFCPPASGFWILASGFYSSAW